MTARGADQVALRLPDGMRDEIKAAAASNGRSMNAEIVARLSGSQATLRDQFAMAALTGMCTKVLNSGEGADAPPEQAVTVAARLAYILADAMIEARSRSLPKD